MAVTKEDIRTWFEQGKATGAFTHMMIIWDSWNDYPAYYHSQAEARARALNPGPGYQVMEVYDLSMDMEAQLDEKRAWHLEES